MTSADVPRKVKTRATKCLERIRKAQAEWESWKGEDMTIVRVKPTDYMALTECGYVRDGKLSGTNLEVKVA